MAVPPLNPFVRITDEQGQPTPDFMQWWTAQRAANASIVPLANIAEVSAVLDLLGDTHGDLLFRGASVWDTLGPGTAGLVLATGGPAAAPVWVTLDKAFTDLTDTPAAYTGAAGQAAVVNAGETGLEFADLPTTFLALTDTPNAYTGAAGQAAVVNAGETALEFADLTTAFLALTDTPSVYTGQAGLVVAVNAGETALEFVAQSGGGGGTGVYDKATFTPIATPSAWTTIGVEDPRVAPSVTVTESDTFGYLGWADTGDILGQTRVLLASAGNPTAGADFDKVLRVDLYQGRNHPSFAGVFVRNSANGRLMTFGLFQTNLRWFRQYWNGATFVSETDVSQDYRETQTFTGYLRLRRIGANLAMFSSLNGISWVLHDTVTVASQLLDVDGVGLFTNPDTGARQSVLLWGLDDGPQDPPARP